MALDITGIGAVADVVGKVIDRFFPNKTEEEKAQLAAALTVIQGQMEVNKVEAGSSSLLVAGWRPFIGWVCGVACAWNWIGLPVGLFVCAYLHKDLQLRPADVSEMWPLLMGMLGLGGLRTIEKVKGAA